ncbi:TPA: transposase [Candidatus Bathyarchaeota archaeon]|nr:transposase [Candidatus Bathyarchaeota archaeon]
MNSLQNYLGLFFFCCFFMEFRELSDGEWEIIEPPLSPKAKADRSMADDRIVLNGILYVLVTGIPRTNPR